MPCLAHARRCPVDRLAPLPYCCAQARSEPSAASARTPNEIGASAASRVPDTWQDPERTTGLAVNPTGRERLGEVGSGSHPWDPLRLGVVFLDPPPAPAPGLPERGRQAYRCPTGGPS